MEPTSGCYNMVNGGGAKRMMHNAKSVNKYKRLQGKENYCANYLLVNNNYIKFKLG